MNCTKEKMSKMVVRALLVRALIHLLHAIYREVKRITVLKNVSLAWSVRDAAEQQRTGITKPIKRCLA